MHKPGIISIASYFLGRYREFDTSLNRTNRPEGTEVDWQLGVNIAYNFNNSIRRMLADAKYEWIWFLGDDHMWGQNVLMDLLARNVDVVVPLSVKRILPLRPIIKDAKDNYFKDLGWEYLQGKTSGLLDITDKTVGNAGMLVRRHILERISPPWYAVGKYHAEINAPDLYFYEQLRNAKARIYLDLDATKNFGHIVHLGAFAMPDSSGKWEAELRGAQEKTSENQNIHSYMAAIFDDWRKNYDNLDYETQQRFYDKVHVAFPDQHRHDAAAANEFLTMADENLNVLEIGGYTGELAKEMLSIWPETKIRSWRNIEISKSAVDKSACNDARYSAECLPDFFWKTNGFESDTLIMSHVLEHIKVENFMEFLSHVKFKRIYIDTPIPESEPGQWSGYMGSHIFESSWDELEKQLEERGYTTIYRNHHIKGFEKTS